MEPVSTAGLLGCEDLSRRVAPKVSGRKFAFPRLLFAEVVPVARAAARRTAGLYTAPNGRSYLCVRRRLEPERPPLVWLGDRSEGRWVACFYRY
jgi:hypothetical protein